MRVQAPTDADVADPWTIIRVARPSHDEPMQERIYLEYSPVKNLVVSFFIPLFDP